MMGCQPQGLLHSPSHSESRYSQDFAHQLQETASVSRPVDSHQQHSLHSSSSTQHHIAQDFTEQLQETVSVCCPVDSHQQHGVHKSSSVAQDFTQQPHSRPEEPAASQTYCSPASCDPAHGHSRPHHCPPPDSVARHPRPEELTQAGRRATETVTFAETGDTGQQQHLAHHITPVSLSLHPPASLAAGRVCDCAPSQRVDCPCVHSHISQLSPPVNTSQTCGQQGLTQRYRQPESTSPSHHQLSPTGYPPNTMLDKKPTLRVVTTDQSPVSPVSSTSSPRFVFPDLHSSSSSGYLASDSTGSPFRSPSFRSPPFRSPIKQEVKVEGDALEGDAGRQQVYGERQRMLSGDMDPCDTLVDSETGSSVLEDSSSSREHSPFSVMAESLSLRSPSEHSPSPLTRTFHQHSFTMASEEEEGVEGGSGAPFPPSLQPELDFHPPKFKKRLHERYVLSLKDAPEGSRVFRKKSLEKYMTGAECPSHSDSKRPISKVERPDSPKQGESSMPKSPRRSSSDTDMVHLDSSEVGGASSADEGDVFLEPTLRARTKHKHKPPSLHQREPLDLSRAPIYPSYRSSSGSSPLIDPEHLSPAPKIFSPVFRSPHRLSYSPHGLMSPQSQSPLCSVPEGGRIFNFNMPSPLEGAHSDSDLISPSPMSPRIFTFPPQGSIMNPMAEVNHLAVSPHAPYTPPPAFMRNKPVGSGGIMDPKWGGDQQGFYSKRSLSESDVTYLCPVCGQVFPTNDNLAKHMTKHLPSETVRAGDNTKVHYCKVCNRSFSRSDMLTRHMRLHTGLKPYECMECGQVFSRSDHLNTHRRTHTGEKPYRCPHCPYAACRRDMITRHMRTHSKSSSRRARYLSVPDDGDPPKASGSVSSTDTPDSQDCSTGGHTCSISSMDSVESELLHSPHPSSSSYLAASVDSLLSPDPDHLFSGPHSSSSTPSRKCSEDMEEEKMSQGHSGALDYDRFMQYRKARNWSTTSLESVDSEEAQLIREVLVDEAFHDPDRSSMGLVGDGGGGGGGGGSGVGGGGGGGGGGTEDGGRKLPSSPKDLVSLETKTLQKCFISPQPPPGSSCS